MASAFRNIPLHRAQPDAARFIDVVLGRAHSPRAPLVEYLVDDTLRKPITTQMLGRTWVDPTPGDRASREAYLDNFIAFWRGMGYDFVRFEQGLPFLQHGVVGEDAKQADGKRHWRDQHHGAIADWDDFERYPWPEVTGEYLANYAYLSAHLPKGMGLIVCHAGGIYEHLAGIMSYEGLCLALYDAPDLVAAVADRLGGLMLEVYRQLVQLEGVIAIFPGDDMGFRSATLIQPESLRRYTLPWHRRYAELAHQHGLPYFLHSCGNLTQILDDLIDDVGIDAKHSYENAIMPVQDFQKTYGHRIGVLGGMDVDILGRGSPDEVRAATRAILDACHPRGRFAIGSGNSIPSYVPVENYLTMLDEALR
ncbi:MAG: uroporphyrinogen decarboxylase family protein [Anaerolineae bacterium]